MALGKIKIGVAPLSGKIMLYRHGKDQRLALERRDVTDEVMAAAAEYARRHNLLTK
jgi:hypothetical protein